MPAVASGATVAVTGATGFIGSHIVAHLLEGGFKVRAVVRDPNALEKVQHLTSLTGASERLTLYRGNLDEPGSYDLAFNGADAVVHTAAVVEVLEVKGDPEETIVKPSVEGVKHVLASAEKAASVKRFVQTSSIIAAMKWDEALDKVFTEDSWNTASTVANGDAYGFAKAAADKIVMEHKSAHFDCVSILPGVNLGPCMTKSHTKSSAVVVRQLLYGNSQGEYRSQFVDVRDTAVAHLKALSLSLSGDDCRRFIVVLDEVSSPCALETPLRQLFPQYKVTANPHPSPALKVLLTMPLIWRAFTTEFQKVMSEQSFRFDNSRSKATLGITYRPLEETLTDTVKSMVDTGFIKARMK